jgi:hypothetical protein
MFDLIVTGYKMTLVRHLGLALERRRKLASHR